MFKDKFSAREAIDSPRSTSPEIRTTIRLNGVEMNEKMNGAIIEEKTANPGLILDVIFRIIVILAFLASVCLLWCIFAPYEHITLGTEQCSLKQQKLDDGTVYLAKEFEFIYTEHYRSEGPQSVLVLSFEDEKGRFGSNQYRPNDDELIILDDDAQTKAYLEVETWTRGKINPITGSVLFAEGEHVRPMKLHIHESELLKLENGTVEKRALKQRSDLVDTEYLAIKKGSEYVFNLEEKGWEFIQGDFSGTEGDDFEVVILEDMNEPAYVEGKIHAGPTDNLGVPSGPTLEDGYTVRAVFEPTRLYIHESEIVEVETNSKHDPYPPTPEPYPEPTPTPEPMYDKDSIDAPTASAGWGRNDDSGPGPDTNYKA